MHISCPRRSEELQIVTRYYGGLGIEPKSSSRATNSLNHCNSPGPTPNAFWLCFVYLFGLSSCFSNKPNLDFVTNQILSLGLQNTLQFLRGKLWGRHNTKCKSLTWYPLVQVAHSRLQCLLKQTAVSSNGPGLIWKLVSREKVLWLADADIRATCVLNIYCVLMFYIAISYHLYRTQL